MVCRQLRFSIHLKPQEFSLSRQTILSKVIAPPSNQQKICNKSPGWLWQSWVLSSVLENPQSSCWISLSHFWGRTSTVWLQTVWLLLITPYCLYFINIWDYLILFESIWCIISYSSEVVQYLYINLSNGWLAGAVRVPSWACKPQGEQKVLWVLILGGWYSSPISMCIYWSYIYIYIYVYTHYILYMYIYIAQTDDIPTHIWTIVFDFQRQTSATSLIFWTKSTSSRSNIHQESLWVFTNNLPNTTREVTYYVSFSPIATISRRPGWVWASNWLILNCLGSLFFWQFYTVLAVWYERNLWFGNMPCNWISSWTSWVFYASEDPWNGCSCPVTIQFF